MRHNIFKEIKTTFSRFMAIFAIVALGVGFFAGLKATTPDMKATTDRYFDDNNLMDIRLLSTMGFTEEDAETLKMQPGIKDVMPTYNCDVLIESSSGISVARIHALPQEGSQIRQHKRSRSCRGTSSTECRRVCDRQENGQLELRTGWVDHNSVRPEFTGHYGPSQLTRVHRDRNRGFSLLHIVSEGNCQHRKWQHFLLHDRARRGFQLRLLPGALCHS